VNLPDFYTGVHTEWHENIASAGNHVPALWKLLLFQSTARSGECATVYITQNLPSLYAKFGGDNAGESRIDSLLGNLVTKIICQRCATTGRS
jgi:hypothetical protein